jgi:hypothetical protein
MNFRAAPFLLLVITLGGCGAEAPPAQPAARDPVMTAALQAPLLVDPDLSQLNGRNLAIVPPGPVTAPHPVVSDAAQ